jgi:hypothetical protein
MKNIPDRERIAKMAVAFDQNKNIMINLKESEEV